MLGGDMKICGEKAIQLSNELFQTTSIIQIIGILEELGVHVVKKPKVYITNGSTIEMLYDGFVLVIEKKEEYVGGNVKTCIVIYYEPMSECRCE